MCLNAMENQFVFGIQTHKGVLDIESAVHWSFIRYEV